MKLKRVNNFFGTSMILIGFFRFLISSLGTLIILSTHSNSDIISLFAGLIGLFQIVIGFGSIIMIFVNMKEYPNVILGYVIGLCAIALEFILPKIIFFVYVFVECGLYIKAGNTIRDKEFKLFSIDNDTNVKTENTDWFFNDKK